MRHASNNMRKCGTDPFTTPSRMAAGAHLYRQRKNMRICGTDPFMITRVYFGLGRNDDGAASDPQTIDTSSAIKVDAGLFSIVRSWSHRVMLRVLPCFQPTLSSGA